MEGEVKTICGVSHTHVRCIECGYLAWTQTVKGGINSGYKCNECSGVRIPTQDLSYKWVDSKLLMDSEV